MALDKTFSSGEILSAGDVNGHLLGLWIPIDKRVIASGSPVTSVSFQGLDSNFRFFRINTYANLAGAILHLRLNNDSGNNYGTQLLEAGGAATAPFRQTSQPQIITSTTGNTSGQPFICEMTIGKTLATVGASVQGTTVRENSLDTVIHISWGGVWRNTAALINRIDLFPSSGTMHGVFALEGMRGV